MGRYNIVQNTIKINKINLSITLPQILLPRHCHQKYQQWDHLRPHHLHHWTRRIKLVFGLIKKKSPVCAVLCFFNNNTCYCGFIKDFKYGGLSLELGNSGYFQMGHSHSENSGLHVRIVCFVWAEIKFLYA